MAYSLKPVTHEVESASDEAFLSLVRGFDSLTTLEEKILFILGNSATAEGIIIPVTRAIDGQLHSYGFNVQGAEADEFALSMHKIFKERMFDYYLTTFPQRLALCKTNLEKVDLVEAELKDQTSFLKHNDIKEYTLGYKFEKLKRDDLFAWCHVDLSDVMQYNGAFFRRLMWSASGATVYRIEMYLSNLLVSLKSGESPQASEKGDPPPTHPYQLSDFIEPELCGLYLEVEERLTDKIEAWRKNNQRIKNECAGFCEALFQKKWFWKAKPDQVSVNNTAIRAFARWRYNLDIKEQLLLKRKANREVYRDLFLGRLKHWGY